MGKKYRASPFVMVRQDLLKDENWRKLSNSSKIIYIYLRAKFNYKTLSEVSLAYSEVKDFLSSQTISNAIKELIKGGWIVKHKQGGLMGGKTTYRFIGRYKDFYYKGYKI